VRGLVPPAELLSLLRGAAALVFPSLYEGFAQPPLEAMACGCPVAVADQGSLREVCGDAALLVDPRSPEAIAGAIDRIAADEGLRATLRDAGLRRSREFDWATAAARHTAIFERVAATPPDELRSYG
jgi:glycosyltransferase involved in cell wall biosynthesis